jgi:hypothetical protein
MNWNAIVEKVAPYVVKIETPNGHGTGFLCLYNEEKTLFGIATANHVVSYADQWQQPIRLTNNHTNTTVFLKESDRTIFLDANSDSAVLLTQPCDLKLPEDTIKLLPTSVPLAIGTEVGWLGFPSIAPLTLCFFSGNISARQESWHSYLIDGVAINGVSGGPVLYSTETEGIMVVGTISAYMSNRATGDSLPGLSVARDVSHFHDTITFIKSLDEAQRKKKEQAISAQEAQSEPSPNLESPKADAAKA